jgi:hypothetical protein
LRGRASTIKPLDYGWLKDKFGVSWQIIPNALGELLGDPDREKAGRVVQAMLGMKKIDIAGPAIRMILPGPAVPVALKAALSSG